jgi:hypothetical protein
MINIYVALLIYLLLKRISCPRSMKISWNNKMFTCLKHFCLNIITISPSFTLLPMYSDNIMLSVCTDSFTTSFPPLIRGTDKQLNVNPWKHMAGNYTFWLHCSLFPHMHFTPCNATSTPVYKYVNQHGFIAALCDCSCFLLNDLKYSEWKISVSFVFTPTFLCLYSNCPMSHELVNIITMTTTQKTSTKHNLPSIHRKLDITNMVDTT